MKRDLRVRVIISAESRSWIIGKMAERLVRELANMGVAATLGTDSDDTADVNHWMIYSMTSRRAGRASSVFITHIDDPHKTAHLKKILGAYADVGLCMSRDTVRALVSRGVPEERLAHILPALDLPSDPSRIRISIATRLYPDGRKREALLIRLARETELSAFHFEISGAGWDEVVPLLEAAGASVRWDPGSDDYQADYSRLIESMRSCDYYLYLGLDEGSLGTLEALALGLKTIVTPQGYHLELDRGITEPVETFDDLREVMDRLSRERDERISAVRDWTWEQYARDHVQIWEALLEDRHVPVASVLSGEARYGATPQGERGLTEQTRLAYYANFFSPSRIADALVRARWFQPIRRQLRKLFRR